MASFQLKLYVRLRFKLIKNDPHSSCKSLSIDLTPPGALVNIYDGQKVTLKCINQDAATQQNNDSNFVKIDANSGEVVT